MNELVQQHTSELDLKECFGEMLTGLGLSSGALTSGEVLRSDSLRDPGLARNPGTEGSTATAPGRAPAVFFLLDGGMRECGNVVGTGSFSIER